MRNVTLLALSAFLAAAASIATGDTAFAQRGGYGYDRYDDRSGGRYRDRNDDRYDDRQRGGQRNVAGAFDYYALVLSWSPTHCASEAGEREGNDLQCNRRDGRRYNFVLHGLWPQYDRGYPENCPTRDRPFVPDRVIDGILEIMPSRKLAIHEYRKHGTCSGLDPAGYFDLSRQLYSGIRIPERYVNPFDVQFVAPEQFVRELMEVNPELKPDMIAVSCGGPGNRLKEIRICYSKAGKLRACGHNENQRRLCSARQMYVPPVRSTSKDPKAGDRRDEAGSRGQQRPREDRKPDYLPGPRGI